jgi:hypothetical protein
VIVSQARGVTRARAATHCTVDSAPPTGHAHDPPRHCTHSIACCSRLAAMLAAPRALPRTSRCRRSSYIDSICTINKLHTACPCALSRKANCMPAARWRVCHLKCHLYSTCHVPGPAFHARVPASVSGDGTRSLLSSTLSRPLLLGSSLYSTRLTGFSLLVNSTPTLAPEVTVAC